MTAQSVRFRLVGEGDGVAQAVREDGSPHVIQTDAHSAFGGNDTAPSPLAYALAALTSCTQVTSQIVARDLGLSLGRFNVAVDAKLDPTVLATGPRASATSRPWPSMRRSRRTRRPSCSSGSAAKSSAAAR